MTFKIGDKAYVESDNGMMDGEVLIIGGITMDGEMTATTEAGIEIDAGDVVKVKWLDDDKVQLLKGWLWSFETLA